MKTTILLFGIIGLTALQGNAQTDKGAVQLGGTVSISNFKRNGAGQSDPGYKLTSLLLSPSIGTFYKANKLAGLFLTYSYQQNKMQFPYVTRDYGGGIFFRQYKPALQKLFVFLDERGGLSYFNGDENATANHGYYVEASLQGGMAYDMAKRIQLELLLNNVLAASYSHSDNSEAYALTTGLERNFLNNVMLGFRFYLK